MEDFRTLSRLGNRPFIATGRHCVAFLALAMFMPMISLIDRMTGAVRSQ